MLDLIVAIHTAPGSAGRRVPADDFAILHRDELEAALRSPADGDEGTDGVDRVDLSATVTGPDAARAAVRTRGPPPG